MKTAIIEATNGEQNWGKFLVGVMTDEWKHRSAVDVESQSPLLRLRAWSRDYIWVMDLETGEGALLCHRDVVRDALERHQVWVCPLFEPFVGWLFAQPMHGDPEAWLDGLPPLIDFPDAAFGLSGYRRGGPDDEERADPVGTRMALGDALGLQEATA
jgi:hypothetical protein